MHQCCSYTPCKSSGICFSLSLKTLSCLSKTNLIQTLSCSCCYLPQLLVVSIQFALFSSEALLAVMRYSFSLIPAVRTPSSTPPLLMTCQAFSPCSPQCLFTWQMAV